MLYDVFISHASEDKGRFVRPLAEALKAANVEVWYDEFSLRVGDSIRQSIDKGLMKSRFGIVVLSHAFFRKNWPQYELDGLATREMAGNDKIILPIWYNISQRDIMEFSPALAGRVALLSKIGKKKIVQEIKNLVHPEGSPLIEARDELLAWGVTPPVITDKYWLDVVEASNRSPAWGAIVPEDTIWDRWSFPLPAKDDDWGLRLAWTAMQLNWVKSAEELSITPLTPPDQVHAFIRANPGLFEACSDYPGLLIEYAPQIAIPGFEGPFKELIERQYQAHTTNRLKQKEFNPISGTELTNNGEFPPCEEEWALRHESFGFYEPGFISDAYFRGGMFGPRVSPYDEAEHLFWLLSDESKWIPGRIHDVLLHGVSTDYSWPWTANLKHSEPFDKWNSCGSLWRALHSAKSSASFVLPKNAIDDLYHRVELIRSTLKIKESVNDLIQKFERYNVVKLWIDENNRREKKRNKMN